MGLMNSQEKQVESLPVVEGGKIVGAITRYDLLWIIRTLSN